MEEIREERDGFVAIRGADGTWRDRATNLPLPGARDMTAAEFLSRGATTDSESGEWVDVLWRDIVWHPKIWKWCQEHAIEDSPRNSFRFERRVFEEAGAQAFPIAYSPELDDPRVHVQRLARSERKLRVARKELDRLERERADRLKVAAENGLSRRELAAFVGLSFARIQQLIARDERPPS